MRGQQWLALGAKPFCELTADPRSKGFTPAAVHYGHAPELHQQRARVLDAADERYPERFVRQPPTPPPLPTATWINKPAEPKEAAAQ